MVNYLGEVFVPPWLVEKMLDLIIDFETNALAPEKREINRYRAELTDVGLAVA